MSNQALIETFYSSFAKADAEAMIACYHDNIVFEDPAFGRLEGEDAKNMWRMLIKSSKGNIQISHSGVKADEHTGEVNWVAEYVFSKTGRTVVNRISARFVFQDGKIIQHTDHFPFYTWAKQALGLPGFLLGWTSFLQRKVRQTALSGLKQFSANKLKENP